WCLLAAGAWPEHAGLQGWGPEAGAAWVAAVEAVLERAEAESSGAVPDPETLPIDELRHDLALFAFGASLAMRCAALTGKTDLAADWARKSLAIQPERANRQIWNDWIAPNDLASRLRLEAARAMYGRGPAPQSILELIAVPFEASPFVPRPKFGIDGDR